MLSLVSRHTPKAIPALQRRIGQLTTFVEDNMTKRIPLTKNQYALVDDEDFESLMRIKWHCTDRFYAVHCDVSHRDHRGIVKYTRTYMHRLVNNTPADKVTDHIDGNTLNNQKHNLRTATQSHNCANRFKKRKTSSEFMGISKRNKAWKAQITVNQVNIYIGNFKTEIEAARAYNEAATKYFGEFARLNIITEE